MTAPEFASYPSLRKRPVIVSGGATGIGEAIVRNFAQQGAKVAFVDIADDAGKALAEELNGKGGEVLFKRCDVRDIDAYQSAIAQIAEAHGDTLALVNNAAFDERHDWREVTSKFWDERSAVNLKHAFFAIQAVAPGMIKAGGGAIVNFGSISWMIGVGDMPAYTTSKAAAHGLSRTMARDLGQHGIRVNTLAPGWVMTERQLEKWVGPAQERLIDETQMLKGRVYPDDVARMVLFLCADDSQMISGQDFIVDGGWAHG